MAIAAYHRVHFYDTDQMAVVHHANYIKWFEIGRVEYLRAIGITLTDMMADGYVFPITSVSAEFHAPAMYDDEITIEVTATALTKAKMAFDYRILRRPDGKLLVTGHTQNVFTHKDSGRITRLPAKYYEPLEKAMAEELAAKENNNE